MQTIRGRFSESEGFALALVRIVREHPTKRRLLCSTVIIFCFIAFYMRATHLRRLSIADTHMHACTRVELARYNASADMHNVVVKAFNIDP